MSRTVGCDAVEQSSDAPARPEGGAVVAADDSDVWLSSLRAVGEERELAVARLHALLLRASRFEAARRWSSLTGVGRRELDDLTVQAADDALVAVLARLDTFRGASRFTTWAFKFAIYQTAVALRRRAWHDREVPLEPQSWTVLVDRGEQPQQHAEEAELVAAVGEGIATLTPHQRDVLVAVTLNDVPIDVLAERLSTTRGALYKTLHDARRKLRAHLAGRGLLPSPSAPIEEAR